MKKQEMKKCVLKEMLQKVLAFAEKLIPNKRARLFAGIGAALLLVAIVVGVVLLVGGNNNGAVVPQKPQEGGTSNLVLHYAAEKGVAEATMKADIAKKLSIPEGTDVAIEGTYDLATAGKYTLTCKWNATEAQVDVWVYSNSVNVTVDGKAYNGEVIYFNYQKASASQNFTTCITFTDSIGNQLAVSKESGRSMSFAGKEGTYVVYYNPTDAAGHKFSVRVEYVVTFEHSISVFDALALTYEDVSEIPVDFDGATGVWLEDNKGKVGSQTGGAGLEPKHVV